jgi:hypothetical protein
LTPLHLAGNVPYSAVLILVAGAFFAGRATVHPHDRIAVAEKGAVVMEAVLQRPKATPEEIDRQVREPIVRLLEQFANDGYAVIDVSKDEQGYMAVAAVPAGTIDITPELRSAVGLPVSEPTPPAPSASAPAASVVTEVRR